MIRFNKPTLKRKDMDNVLQTMVDEQIGSGEREKQFMSSFAALVGCNSAIGFRTYPDCIKAALLTAGATADSVVAISPLAPSSYLDALKEIGCSVAYVDSSKENGLPSEESVSSANADILVLYENCGSLPLRYDEEEKTVVGCNYNGVTVIEDVSESVGSSLGDFKPGNWGNVVICSFEQDDVISAAGGAALAVKDLFVDTLKQMKPDDLVRMTDLCAALGIVQLENLEENRAKCREIYEMYGNGMKSGNHKLFGLNLLEFRKNAGSFAVFLDCKPDDIIQFALKKDVPVLKTFENSIAKNYEGDLFEICPVCASFFHRTVSFPIYPFLKAAEIDLISKIISHLP